MGDTSKPSKKVPAHNVDRSNQLNESTFRLLVNCATDYATFALDEKGHVATWNIGAERLFGYSGADIIGMPASVLYAIIDTENGVPENDLSFATTLDRYEVDAWRVRHNGSNFYAHVILEPIRNKSKDVIGFAYALKVLSNETIFDERFKSMIETIPNAIVAVNSQGRIVAVNAHSETLFGYARGELLGQDVEALIPAHLRDKHLTLRNNFLDKPTNRLMGTGRNLYGLRKDGSKFSVEIGLSSMETKIGAVVLATIVDISSHKRMEEKFRLVAESAPNAMVMVNGDGNIEMINTQAETVFGYTRVELLGRPVELLIPTRFHDYHPAHRKHFFESPVSRPMGIGRDLYARRKDGSEFAVEIGLNPIETDEGVMVLSAIVDISDRKAKEASIEAALKEKDLLLSEIHHRVKNNLQIIKSLIDLQSTKITDPVVLEMITETQNRIESMALIHQTMYQSHDFAGVDLATFLENLAPVLLQSYSVNTARITLDIDTCHVLLPINVAIPCGLIVNELITNALKHAFPENKRGVIRISLALDRANFVRLTVTDDGVGIDPSIDLKNSTSLGLKLVTLLADQLGGLLAISRKNPTEFVVRFPSTLRPP